MKHKRNYRDLTFKDLLPNMVTSGNLICGMLSIILVIHGQFVPAGWLIFIAVFFDFMDGKIARRIGAGSKFGLEYDSLADVISFGVAPALLLYSVYLKDVFGVIGALIASFFVLCGALRLARFNIVHIPGPFQGLPIPAAGLFVASFVIGEIPLPFMVASFLLVSSGLLMISSIPWGNLKGMKHADRKKVFLFYFICIGLIITLHSRSILTGMVIYITSGFMRIDWSKFFSRTEDEDYLEEK
ncbi:MAG: CDP-diacylglycerol--serine O-phosphatidyltransferase [Synergistales bacterium]|nr:CDP-diacylglycerol--serine O-phosphatidyltransferase [Synergistales bacterium]